MSFNMKEYQKQYRERNKEKLRKQKIEYNEKHKEEKKKYNQKYYQKNEEKMKKDVKKYRENNPDKIKKYRIDNKEKKSEYIKNYRKNNLEKIKLHEKEYEKKRIRPLDHKEKRQEYGKKYRKENVEKSKQYRLLYKKRKLELHKERMKTDIQYKIRYRVASAIKKALKSSKHRKSTFNLLSYTKKQLVKHLISTIPEGYVEDDIRKNNVLHIDHIIPASLYEYSSYEDGEFKKCWSLKNLRLLPAFKNISKSNKLDWNLIEKYNLYDILPKNVLKKKYITNTNISDITDIILNEDKICC